jgi:hypothetical protein
MTQNEIEIQAQIVRKAYAKEPMSEEYEREFDKLSEMKRIKMANDYRKERGILDPKFKTPYCN